MSSRTDSNVSWYWLVVAAPVAFFLGQALAPGAGLYTSALSARTIDWIGALPKLVFPALAFAAAVGVSRRFEADNPVRPAWVLLAAGLLGFVLGQGILLVYFVQGRTDVFPSVGDIFFVIGSVGLIAALVAFLRAYAASGFPIGQPRDLWRIGLAATLLAGALAVPVLRPVIAAPAPVLEKLLNIAYPTLDFFMLIPAVLLLWVTFRFRGGRVWSIWAALLSGIFFTAVADILFGYFSGLGQTQLDGLLDATYILAYGCMAGSVLYQRELLQS